jgi:hypothetical protein
MKIYKKYFVPFWILGLLLSGCNGSITSDEKMSGIDIGISKMNQEMDIHLYPRNKPRIIGDDMEFYIQNISNSKIIIKKSQAYKLYIRTDNRYWQEVQNNTFFPNNVFNLAPRQGNKYDRFTSGVSPDISISNKKILLSIIVLGQEINSNNTIKNIAAYVDVTINP